MQCCVYAHALSCTEHMSRKRIWSLKWQTKTKKKKLAIYRSWPWISNCWLWDSNSGLSGIEPRALTTRPRRLGANLRRDATSRLLFLNQSVLADFDPRKKKKIRILRLVAFQARVITPEIVIHELVTGIEDRFLTKSLFSDLHGVKDISLDIPSTYFISGFQSRSSNKQCLYDPQVATRPRCFERSSSNLEKVSTQQ